MRDNNSMENNLIYMITFYGTKKHDFASAISGGLFIVTKIFFYILKYILYMYIPFSKSHFTSI